jgi:hypothetical protein
MTRHSHRATTLGVGQLTLVEHALCPLDARASVTANLVHEAQFRFSNKARQRQTGSVRVLCPLGLSPKDEFFLWGLLALTIADPESEGELHATRHYCLRRLGLIDAKEKRGGRQYRDFTAAIERLSCVRYQCDKFYDPLRAEHRRVSFGFFSYSLPIDDDSSRAWRFVWDPIFFEFVRAAGGSLRFNLEIYRQLDVASRRLYLFLAKLFFRHSVTSRLDLNDVAEQILGVAPTVSLRDKKARMLRCIIQLIEHGVILTGEISRVSKGRFALVFHRGAALRRPGMESVFESPLIEPLLSIGFDVAGADRILRRFKLPLVREWVDITLAAEERFGKSFFKRGGPAFLTDNLKQATAGQRTPPDWWADLRSEERRACAERARQAEATGSGNKPVAEQAADAVRDVHRTIFAQFLAAGQPEDVARENARKYRAARDRIKQTKP